MNHHRARLKDCLPGSGRWLFKNEKFVQWRKSSVSSLIWLHGIPGSGKSILVSSVIEHLYSENFENKQAAPISYFYCTRNAAEPERANPDEILRCILEQLSFSGVDPSMREAVVEAYKKKKKEAKGRAPEKLSLSETVELVPLLLENNPAIIVIDALDECDPARRPDLIIALDSIIQESSSLVKVLISSRSDGDIACHLGKWPGVRIEERDNKVDIEKFVRTKVAQAIEERRLIKGNVSKQLEDKIIEALTSGAQGMFRWVSLQIQNLCDSRRIKYEGDVIAELGRLPESLVESYDITYQTISNAGETSRTVAERVMKWLICAQRPLKIQELYAAVSLDSEGKYLVPAIDDLLDACCNMVVPDSELEVFRFAHLSVREYLEKREGYGLLETHKLALERCLDILTRCPTATPSVESTVQQTNIFRPYTTLYWPMHYRIVEREQFAGVGPGALWQKLRPFLFEGRDTSPLFIKWMSAARELSQSLRWDDPLKDSINATLSSPPTPLFLACSFGLVSIMNELGSGEHLDWNQRNEKGNTALDLAAAGGHETVVEILSNRGAEITAATARGRTALHRAAEHGHKAVVKLLLEKGADIAAKDDRGATALHEAAGRGHEVVVMVLLEMGADIAAKDNRGGTALHVAARHGHATMVQQLLNNGANVEAKDASEWTALHGAAGQGHEAVVRLLLENCADTMAMDAHRGTALHWASGHGHETVAQLLLKGRADVAARDAYGLSALHAAAVRGHAVLVRLLLENGADIAANTIHGETPLHLAAGREHKAVVQVLYEHCEDLGIPAYNEGMNVPSKLPVSPSSRLYCDNCDVTILSSDAYYHCNICDDGDFDLCQRCLDKGVLCYGDGHRLIKRSPDQKSKHHRSGSDDPDLAAVAEKERDSYKQQSEQNG